MPFYRALFQGIIYLGRISPKPLVIILMTIKSINGLQGRFSKVRTRKGGANFSFKPYDYSSVLFADS